ncbi:tetratricopeptide repeat protein [Sporomusa carbonis]|uniref:tetratricopeptide repeat protein n=1 Tax=Sporomusa carbonis TaxID=3076075 RepID=UPI003C7B1296
MVLRNEVIINVKDDMVMEKYQKHGINPLLISMASGQDIASVSPRPTVAMLPGKYPKLVYKHIKELNSEFAENIFRLTCGKCGKNGDYDLGTLAIPVITGEGTRATDKFQAVGYFRCKHCNAAGDWNLSPTIQTMLAGKLAAAVIKQTIETEASSDIVLGQVLIDNDFTPRWGSDAEDYFLEKLGKNPENAYLWNRLGNIYYKGKRPELAVTAYEQALARDAGQVESMFSLGRILADCGYLETAAEYLRQAVAFAHQYNLLTAHDLRELIVSALTILLAIYNKTDHEIDMLPTPNELAIAQFANSEIAATVQLDFEINPGRCETLYPLAEVYMGARRDELPPAERKTPIPRRKVAWPLPGKVNKQKPPKKNKNKKR